MGVYIVLTFVFNSDMQATAPQILIIAALLDNGAEILKVMQVC